MEMTSHINKGLFYSIFQNIPVAVLLIDQDFNYLNSNVSFLDFSGLTVSGLTGKGWSQYLQKDKEQELFDLLLEMKVSGIFRQTRSANLLKKTGLPIGLIVTSEPDEKLGWFYYLTFWSAGNQSADLRTNNLNAEIAIASLNPITNQPIEIELKFKPEKPELNQSVEEWNRQDKTITELRASNRLKDKILAIVSHDMSAPIASLKGLTSSFLDEELSVKERALLRENLLKQLDSVGDLTESLLRWATNSFMSNDGGTAETLNLLHTVERSVQLILHQASLKNIKVSYEILSDLSVHANKEQFQIVVRNVITNSMKYTPYGGEINISAVASGSHVDIRIADTGIGISEEKLSKLFSYTQGNTYGTNGEKGIGLGLMLCKEYVEANGGQITVLSDGRSGTTVLIRLPAAL